MAQKKKAPVSPKSAAKTTARKSVPLKVAASANKSAKVTAKAKLEPVVKAKSQPVAAAKVAAKKPAPVVAKAAAAPVKPVAPAAKSAVQPSKAPIKVPPAAASSQAVKKPGAPVAVPAHVAAAHLSKAATQRAVAVPAAAHKAASQKISAPVATAPAAPSKDGAARDLLAVQKKPVNQRHGFKANEFVVYPAHGVGRIVGIEEQEIAGMSLELFVITFDKEKLTLRVPTGKLASVGMRKLADEALVRKAMETLKGRARIKRTMWSRRAQEYVAKINSGDLISIAEVVRDLYRSEAQPEQSYSERQLYEDALDRMARELAAVEKLDERGAVQRITDILSKSAKGRRMAEEAAVEEEAA
jgi:CarD family transcriptional regulator